MKRNTQLRKEWELYFGESLDGYELHHIISFYEGGTDDFSNLKKVTTEEHKLEHLNLYNKNGNFRDLCSYYYFVEDIVMLKKLRVVIGGRIVKEKQVGIFDKKYDDKQKRYTRKENVK